MAGKEKRTENAGPAANAAEDHFSTTTLFQPIKIGSNAEFSLLELIWMEKFGIRVIRLVHQLCCGCDRDKCWRDYCTEDIFLTEPVYQQFVAQGTNSLADYVMDYESVQTVFPTGQRRCMVTYTTAIASTSNSIPSGIGEKIQSYFQVRERFPSHFRDHSCLGVILSAEGTVYSPRMNRQGSAVVYEGLHDIVKFSGFYFMPKNGQVQLSGSLKMTFCDPDGGVFGGLVIGSLIAATSLQVAVLTFIHDV